LIPDEGDPVALIFAEPYEDPSENLVVTYMSTSDDGDLLEWRSGNPGAWTDAPTFRSRAIQDATNGEWLHTALIDNLSPDTAYEFRVKGTEEIARIKTCPATSLRIAVISDFQDRQFFSGRAQALRTMGGVLFAHDPDLLIFNGDLVSDNGRFGAEYADAYVGLLDLLLRHYHSDGLSMPPILTTIGNHETTSNNGSGDGTLSYIHEVFTFGYDSSMPTRLLNSASWLEIGSLLKIVTLETSHSEALSDQLLWFGDQLDDMDDYTHGLVIGHAPAFTFSFTSRYTITLQARTLRNFFWPLIQTQENIPYYICGHDHVATLTKSVKMDYDDQLSLADNDLRFYTNDGGPIQLGSGAVGGNRRALAALDDPFTSTIDSSVYYEGAVGLKDGVNQVVGEVDNGSFGNSWNAWLLDFDASGHRARCFNLSGSVYFDTEDE
jgi:hypothetical protein